MDIADMLEKARSISEAINESSDNVNDENNKSAESTENNNVKNIDDFGQAMRLMKLMKIMGEINKTNDKASDEKENIHVCDEKKEVVSDFEQDLQTPAIRTIKAAIPYLDFEYQRNIGIMVKIIELDNLIKRYQNTAIAMDTGRKEGWQKEMLLSMKSELDKKNQYYIDMLVRFMDIKDIIAKVRLEEENNGSEI